MERPTASSPRHSVHLPQETAVHSYAVNGARALEGKAKQPVQLQMLGLLWLKVTSTDCISILKQ